MTIGHGIPNYPVERQGGYRPPLAAGFGPEATGNHADGNGFSFGDLIDAVNPLQHIPVVSSIYRRLTGDDIDTLPRVAGGAIFGGLIGGAVSIVNAVIERATGDDLGGHVLTAFLGKGDSPGATENPPMPVVAAAKPGAAGEVPPTGAVALPGAPAISLDRETFDALARTLGASEPLAHLAPPAERRAEQDTTRLADNSSPDIGADAKFAYEDALIRMQAAMDQYETQRTDKGQAAR